MVHQWVPIKNALAHLDDIQIMVPERHPVPQERTITWLRALPVAVFAYNILYSIQFTSAVVCVYNDLSSANLSLLFPIHDMVLGNAVLLGSQTLGRFLQWGLHDLSLSFGESRSRNLVLAIYNRTLRLFLFLLVALLLLESDAIVVEDYLLFGTPVVPWLYLRLAAFSLFDTLIVHLGLGRRIIYAHHLAVVVLNLDLF